MKTRAYFIGLILLICLTSLASAYTIVGNSVIEEDAASKLEVYPHTIYSPIASNLEQTFKLTNKTANSQNVYIAYKFDKPIQAGKVFTITPAVYEWVENQSFTCNAPYKYTYELNKYPTDPSGNVNFLHCYQTLDNNTPGNTNDDFNITIKDVSFSRGDLPAKTIYWKTWTQTAAQSEIDHSNLFSNATYLNDTYYYLANPITFNAGETKTWNLRYTPNKLDTSKKWELVFYTGANANCIINNSCNYVQWLDPWWGTNWTYRQNLILKTSAMSLGGNVTKAYAIPVDINSTNTSFWAHIDSNANSLRFINKDGNYKYTFHKELFDYANQKAIFWVRLGTDQSFLSATDYNFYMYYGNSLAPSDNNETGTYQTGYILAFHMDSNKNYTGQTIYDLNSVGSPTLTAYNDVNCQFGKCYRFNGSNYFTMSQGAIKNLSAENFSIVYWATAETNTNGQYTAYSETSTGATVYQAQSWAMDKDVSNYYAPECRFVSSASSSVGYKTNPSPNPLTKNMQFCLYGSSANTTGIHNLEIGSTAQSPITLNRANYTYFRIGSSTTSATGAAVNQMIGTLDELRLFNYRLASEEYKLLYYSESDNATYLLKGIEESTSLPSIDINFIVKSGYDGSDLINSMDCNSGTITYSNQQSPYLKQIFDLNKYYTCSFTSNGYDTNTKIIYTDVNQTQTIFLTKSTGNLHFYLYDENTGSPLTSFTADFNSNTYNSTGSKIDLNLRGLTTGTYTITFNKSGYSSRVYQADLNQYSDFNKAFALRDSNSTTNIGFKIYQTDAVSLYSNTYVEMLDQDTNYIVGRFKTDSVGEVSFNLNSNDTNYWTIINDGEQTYSPIVLTILYPKDEETTLSISDTWRVEITQNLFLTYSNLNSNKVVYLLPNVKTPYNIRIEDTNGNYFARNYQLNFPGNPGTYTLQPYLVSVLNGLLTTIRSVSGYNNQPISNVNIKIYKDISGGLTLIEDVITDDKGEAIVLMVTGDAYYFYIYYNGLLLRIDNISATSSTIYLRIDDLLYTNPIYENISALVNFAPAYGTLSLQDKKLIQVIKINDSNSDTTISRIWINVINTNANGIDGNNVIIYSLIIPYTDQNTITNTIDINALTHLLNGVSYDTEGRLLVQVIIETDDANYTSRFEYQPYRGTNPIYSLGFGSRSFFGCDSYYDQYGNPNPLIPCGNQLLIALFISFICVASLSFTLSFTNPSGLGAIFLLIMGIFTYLTFVPIVLYGIMVAAFFVVVFIAKGRFN